LLRYRLDDLGWAQFEWLIQSLLKIQLGVGVEAWGGPGDHGCDAWSSGPLYFPLPNTQEAGPFVFQAKFVEGANAAGAEPAPALLKAVQREALRIAKRLTARTWLQEPRHYALLTNAVLSADVRSRLRSELTKAIPTSQVAILDGNDVSALLDQHPTIRRAFPQLLSLRDLDVLLAEVVNHELLERSQAAKEAARDVVSVFVPTEAYGKAWRVLREHHFVVLEGPPEMGKSAIAWMLALNLICEGWHGLVCDGPDDFFRGYDPAVKQVFVADDAFGRTEYDPGRGRQWEVNLHRVFTLVNATHWLIWTSRKHILERARAAMDLQGTASRFPRPGEVLVDTTKLSPREKAFILYRHGRSAHLEAPARDVVKTNASGIVLHEHFTPERVRRFVAEKLPALAAAASTGHIDQGQVAAEIQETIRNPTGRMRKSFQALPDGHKWFLYALLEASALATPEEVSRLYEALCPPELARPFDEVRDELLESFVFEYRTPRTVLLRWMHPSYRDLVIEELARDQTAYERFMTHMSLAGVKLAISDSGGSRGERQLPLMGSEHSWVLLEARCVEIAGQRNRRAAHDLLAALYQACQTASLESHRVRFAAIVGRCLRVLRPIWSTETLSAHELQAYAKASEVADVLEPLPSLEASWEPVAATPSRSLSRWESDYFPDADDLEAWSDLVDFIVQCEPRFLRRPSTRLALIEEVGALESLAKELADSPGEPDDADAARGDGAVYGALSNALESAASFVGDNDDVARLRLAAERAADTARKLEELAVELEAREGAEGNEDGSAWEGGASSPPGFDVAAVFSDF